MEKGSLGKEIFCFLQAWLYYCRKKGLKFCRFFEEVKSAVAAKLYFQRGRYIRTFTHSGLLLMVLTGVVAGPKVIGETFPSLKIDSQPELPLSSVLSAATGDDLATGTLISLKPRAEIIDYSVQPGDTISTIAEKFGVSIDAIRWQNNLESVKTIKLGQVLKIPPVTGIVHKVQRGETVYSVAKKYNVDPQGIVDWPYNTFANDETFELAAGQTLVVPDGVMPKAAPVMPAPFYAQVPGGGLGTGKFLWPTSGRITQGFRWYHRALDIADKAGPMVMAADSGVVIVAGWVAPVSYGNRVMLDHGNGFVTLYAHMSQIHVSSGQKVNRGQVIGKMGSTGRSTGVHLHFEIRFNGQTQDPSGYLK